MSDDLSMRIEVEARGTEKALSGVEALTKGIEELIDGGGRVSTTLREAGEAAGQFNRTLTDGTSTENATKNMAMLQTAAAGLRREYALLKAANPGASLQWLTGTFGEGRIQSIRDSERGLNGDPVADSDRLAAEQAANERAAAAAAEQAYRQKREASAEYARQGIADSLRLAETQRSQELATIRRVIEERDRASARAGAAAQGTMRDSERIAASIRSGELAALREVIQTRSRLIEQGRTTQADGASAIRAQQYENLLDKMRPVEAAERRMTDAIARNKDAVAAAASAQGAYGAAVRNFGKGSIEAAEAQIRLGKANMEVAESMALVRNMTNAYNSSLQGTEVRVQALQYALFYTSFTLTAFGAAGLAALKQVFSASIEMESQFAQVNRTVQDYSASTRQSLEEITTEIPASVESVAEIAALGGALNINAANIVAFTTTVAKLTATTNLTEQAAGNLIGRMDALLDLDSDGSDFEKIGAAVLSVGAQSAATESAVAAMAAQVAGLGKNVGLSAPEIIGWSGALASVGISAELGRSSLQRIFNQMNKGARTGGVQLATLGRIAGTTGDSFRKQLGEDASGALLSVVGGLRQMTDEGQDTVRVLNEIGIRNVRDVYTLQQLAAAYDNTAASIDNANTAYNDSAATMDRYYGPIAATTAARIQILESVWRRFVESVGNSANGPLNDVVKRLTEIVTGLQAFSDANPEWATMAVNAIAFSAGLFLVLGVLAQLGSSAANFLFVQQQLKAVFDGMNVATLPEFVRNMLIKMRVVDADTVKAQVNAAANAKAATATQSWGAAALTTGRNIAAGVAKFAGWLALFASIAAIANLVTNAILKPGESIKDFYASIGRGDPIIAKTTEMLNGLAIGVLSVAGVYYDARAWMDKNVWGQENRNSNDPYYLNWRTATDGVLEAQGALQGAMNETGGAVMAAEEEIETYGDVADEATQKVLELTGQTDVLATAADEVPESLKAATAAVIGFTESLAKSAEEYIKFQEIVNASVSKDEEGNAIGVGGVGESATTKALDEILAGYNARNDGAQAFQRNLIEIGEMGGQALATVLAETGVENAAGIAEALVNSPEHQRQFQIQARIAGLLANKAFTLALGSGAGDSGISDMVATQMAELGVGIDTIFGAIEASSYGIGSKEWIKFVEDWNAEQAANPLTFDSFDFAPLPTATGDVAQMFYNNVQDQFAQSFRGPQGPVRVDVPIDPNFLFDAQGNDTRYAGLMDPVVAMLQSQLDASVITPPMAFDTIAVVQGYESWKAYVAARPTLAEIDTTVDWTSVSAMIEAIRAALRRQSFAVDVRPNVRPPVIGQPGMYAVAKGGYIDDGGVGHFARGGGWGLIRGRGTGTSDSVPSWLSKGEYVQTAAAVSHYGVPMMDAIRSKSFPTTEDFARLLQRSAEVSGNQGPQSVTNVAVTQMYPQTVDPLKKLREDSENVVAGLFG